MQKIKLPSFIINQIFNIVAVITISNFLTQKGALHKYVPHFKCSDDSPFTIPMKCKITAFKLNEIKSELPFNFIPQY